MAKKIGVIGGSGLDNPDILTDYKTISVNTPYGKPGSEVKSGFIGDNEVFIIGRHGTNHEITPTHINNRANITALKELGVDCIIATTAVGSLNEKIGRGHFVLVDQFIDFTKHRVSTFYDDFNAGMQHAPMAEPFDESLRALIYEKANELNLNVHKSGTLVTIEGPRFSTKAESHMFRQWGADIINMTTAPECALANEAGIPYVAVAMSTDYDCWKEDEEPVSFEAVLEVFKQNVEKVLGLIITSIRAIR